MREKKDNFHREEQESRNPRSHEPASIPDPKSQEAQFNRNKHPQNPAISDLESIINSPNNKRHTETIEETPKPTTDHIKIKHLTPNQPKPKELQPVTSRNPSTSPSISQKPS